MGEAQVVADDMDGEAEGGCGFFGGHAPEVAHFDEAGEGLILAGERVEGRVERDDFNAFERAAFRRGGSDGPFRNCIAASLFRQSRPRMIHQDLAHDAGRDSEKVDAAVEIASGAFEYPDVGLVYEGRRLQGMVTAFTTKAPGCDPAQLGIGGIHQLIQRLPVPGFDSLQ